MSFEVELFNEAPAAVKSVRRTIEGLGFSAKLKHVDGKFVIESINDDYLRWAVIKQGYVKQVK